MVQIIISFITIVFAILYGITVLYFFRGWFKIKKYSPSIHTPSTFVSVLIAARNEENNIGATIEDIIAQQYPAHLLEIIVVDDHSTDRTAEIIESYKDRRVKLIRLNEAKPLNSYKKKAITEAIHLSTGELMVATDADCRMGPTWLRTIVALYEEKGYCLISAPVVYFDEKNIFEELQTLEFLYLIGLGAATIGNKNPSTCNGANLTYRKDIFYELNGFQGIDDLASGDDELFLHKVAARYPQRIGFCKSRNAIVYTKAKENVSSFVSQRKRWASKSTHYKKKSIVALGVSVWLFNVFILLTGVMAVFYPEYWQVVLFCLGTKFFVELLFMIPMCYFVKRLSLLWYLPFLSILHVFYLIYIGIIGNGGRYQWKGRMVR